VLSGDFHDDFGLVDAAFLEEGEEFGVVGEVFLLGVLGGELVDGDEQRHEEEPGEEGAHGHGGAALALGILGGWVVWGP
jgi:hypothetical protein